MLEIKQQKKIEKENKIIEEAVSAARLIDSPEFKIILKNIKDIEKKFRFQDILGIKDDAIKDQKGIVLGINEILNYFKNVKLISERPRRDPITGQPEKMRE
ncbi:MAG: hypothetical protein WC554_04795 [Clostridia bacterium]